MSSGPKWALAVSAPATGKNQVTKPVRFAETQEVGRGNVGGANAPARNSRQLEQLRFKKSWDVALAPAKQIPMQFFMMWMFVGNSLNIFGIFFIGMMLFNPIKSMASINQTFQAYDGQVGDNSLLLPKLLFLACNLLALGIVAWKLNGMGLLAWTPADDLMFMERPEQWWEERAA
eukprot:Clim_evm17s26 gene=Clim_evmTU17s26